MRRIRKGALYIVQWPGTGVFKVGSGRYRANWFSTHTDAEIVWCHNTKTWFQSANWEALTHEVMDEQFPRAFTTADQCIDTLRFRGGWTECYLLVAMPIADAIGIASGIARAYCESCQSASCTDVRTYGRTNEYVDYLPEKRSPKATRAMGAI